MWETQKTTHTHSYSYYYVQYYNNKYRWLEPKPYPKWRREVHHFVRSHSHWPCQDQFTITLFLMNFWEYSAKAQFKPLIRAPSLSLSLLKTYIDVAASYNKEVVHKGKQCQIPISIIKIEHPIITQIFWKSRINLPFNNSEHLWEIVIDQSYTSHAFLRNGVNIPENS